MTIPPKRRNKSADSRKIRTFRTEELKLKGKKYDDKKFHKQLESFNNWEKRRKERLEKLRQERIQKELDTVNNKYNVHYKKKMTSDKLPDVLDRLYTKDIQKRKEKQQILTKIYTPTFTPFLYYKENLKKRLDERRKAEQKNQQRNNRTTAFYRNYNYYLLHLIHL